MRRSSTTSNNCHSNDNNDNNQNNKKKSKSVRFPEDEAQLVSVLTIQIDPLSAPVRWFQKDDYFEFKACARRVAREWRKRGVGPLLDGTYEDASSSSNNINSSNNNNNTQEVLTTWSRQQMGTPSRRGLENLINRNLCKARSELRTKVLSSILSAQKTMQGYGFEAAMQARELALISEVYSERAKQFALQMGFADAIALAEANRQESAALLAAAADEESSFPASDRSSESETSSSSDVSSAVFVFAPSSEYSSPSRQKQATERQELSLLAGTPTHQHGGILGH